MPSAFGPPGWRISEGDAQVGGLPSESSIIRLIGAVLLEANDEWQTQNRYMQTEPMAELMANSTKPQTVRISTAAA